MGEGSNSPNFFLNFTKAVDLLKFWNKTNFLSFFSKNLDLYR